MVTESKNGSCSATALRMVYLVVLGFDCAGCILQAISECSCDGACATTCILQFEAIFLQKVE